MTPTDKDKLYIVIALAVMVILDLTAIAGILIKGHANFIEVFKHLKHV